MRSIGKAIAAVAAAVLLSGAAPGTALAEQQTIIGVEAMSQDVRVGFDKTGQAIMDHIAAAQKLMAGSTDFVGAQRETAKALALLKSLKHESPTQRFHDEMSKLLHHNRAKKAKAEDYVPVMGVLDDVKQLSGVEVEDTHDKLTKLKGKVQATPTVDAEADLIDATDDIGYLEIDLPIQETETRLVRALIAESQKDAPNANASLSEAMKHTKEWTATVHASLVEDDDAD